MSEHQAIPIETLKKKLESLRDELEGEVMGPIQHFAGMLVNGDPSDPMEHGFILESLFEAGHARISKIIEKHFHNWEGELETGEEAANG